MIRPCKPKWIERKKSTLKHQSEQLWVAEKYTKGGGGLRPPPPLYVFWLPKFFELLLKVSYFFLSIHFGLQGLSKITFWGPWTYLTNNSHCKLRNLVALRGQKSKKTGTCESKAACKFSKKLIPEGFKSRFDTVER